MGGLKSIHFSTPPTMNGKLTMRYTDVVIENFKPKMLAAIHKNEMAGRGQDAEMVDYEDHLASWDCHHCDWWRATGIYRPHNHEYD